jgi:serine/threonine protein kinase
MRGFQPANIMHCRDPQWSSGKEFLCKLVDFGLAVESGIRASDSGGLTTTGAISGTPEFMGPLASSGAADPRVDLWAVGVTVFVCATFEMPFRAGQSGFARLPVEKLRAKHPAPPALGDAVDKALHKNWEEGFTSAHHFKSALETALRQRTGLTTIKSQLGGLGAKQDQALAKMDEVSESVGAIAGSVEELIQRVHETLATVLICSRSSPLPACTIASTPSAGLKDDHVECSSPAPSIIPSMLSPYPCTNSSAPIAPAAMSRM